MKRTDFFKLLVISLIIVSCEKEKSTLLDDNIEVYKEQYCRGYFNDLYMDATLIDSNYNNYYNNYNEITRGGSTLNLIAFTHSYAFTYNNDTVHNELQGGWWFSVFNLDLEYIEIPCIIDLLRDENGKISAYRQLSLTEPYPQFHISNRLNIVSNTALSDDYFYLYLDKYENNYLEGRFRGEFPSWDSTYTVKDGEFTLKIFRTYDPEIE